jgi:Na+/proline symporter
MTSDTWLAHTFGWMLGTTPGAGLGLQYVLGGAFYCLTCLFVFFFIPAVRNLEDRVPDHDAKTEGIATETRP